MQTFNIMLDIGGDAGNQIPKPGVTAAEIAVLIAIHGEAAVHDIEPAGDKATINLGEGEGKWTNRAELERLRRKYGRAKDGEDHSIVDNMFPGMAARVFETIDELNIDESFFKPTARAFGGKGDHDGDGKTGGTAAPTSEPEGLAALTVAQLKELAAKNNVDLDGITKKADIIAALELAAEGDDDVGDMADTITPPPSPEPKPAEEALFG